MPMLPRCIVVFRRLVALSLSLVMLTPALHGQLADDDGLGADPGATIPPSGDYGYLGVFLAPAQAGAVVTGVVPNSPAAVAGLQRGDVITSLAPAGGVVEPTPIAGDVDAGRWLQQARPGESITISYLRNDFVQTLDARLGERPAAAPPAGPEGDPRALVPPTWNGRPVLMGVTVGPTPEDLRQRLQLPAGGAYVLEVKPGYPAAAARLPAGAIIWAVNGESISTPQEFGSRVQAAGPGGSITLTYYYGTREPQRVSVNLAGAGGAGQWQGRAAEEPTGPANAPAATASPNNAAQVAALQAEIRRLEDALEIAEQTIAELQRRLAAAPAAASAAESSNPASTPADRAAQEADGYEDPFKDL